MLPLKHSGSTRLLTERGTPCSECPPLCYLQTKWYRPEIIVALLRVDEVPSSNLSSKVGTLPCHPPSLKKLPNRRGLYHKIGHDRWTVRSLQFICYSTWTPGSDKTVLLWEVKVLLSNQKINKPMAFFTDIALSASDKPSNPLTVFCGGRRRRPVRCQLSRLLCFKPQSILKQ